MTKTHRKRHLQIWAILAVLLPAGIFVAWLSVPPEVNDRLLQPHQEVELPVILHTSYTNPSYNVEIRTNTDSSAFQLKWVNKQTLTYPTATIYKMPLHDTDIAHGLLVGRVEARGDNYFKLDASFKDRKDEAYGLVVYDFIHKHIIDTITF
ncbi:hypothetical protein I5907_18580 [Panacibacter sp. DH6]|uniref:Uncharacterized protein n=1 Tax=Panacibacter microcysteis TaxID=2793269 RepID=A0A931GZL2_9BACT|nr:hypothetical protein [Panacibacter microcysteis]MBG9378252.1 hypothetical protein [Panacibacter microcysteis]